MDFSTVTDLVKNNQFIQGGLSLGIAGGIIATTISYLKNLPIRFWSWISRYFILTLTQDNPEDKTFEFLLYWLSEKFKNKKQKNFITFYDYEKEAHSFVPGYGLYYFRVGWKFGSINVIKKEAQNTLKNSQIIIMNLWFGSVKDIDKILLRGQELAEPVDRQFSKVYKNQYQSWEEFPPIEPIKLENYVFDKEIVDILIRDIEKFRKSKEWYEELGIPWHRGFLFYGPPGNGKSTLIKLLASYFKFNLCLLDLNRVADDNALLSLLAKVPKNSFIAIEDVDTFSVINQRKTTLVVNSKDNIVEEEMDRRFLSSLSLSGVLNCLDGIGVPSNGRIIFTSSNHKDKLDAALLRPGRIDRQIEIKQASKDQFMGLSGKFFKGREEEIKKLSEEYVSMNIVDIQEEAMRYIDDYELYEKSLLGKWNET